MALVFTMVSAAKPSASSGTPTHEPDSDHVRVKPVTEDIRVHHKPQIAIREAEPRNDLQLTQLSADDTACSSACLHPLKLGKC